MACQKITCCPPSIYGYEIDRGNPNPPPIANYTLVLNVDPSEGGSATGAGVYLDGQNATITAIPASGYNFIGWSGSYSSSSNPAQVFMDGNKTIQANFALKQYILTITSLPENGGVTTGSDVYESGDTATLTAFPATNYEFLSFSGDVNTTDNPANVVMDGNKNVIANFDRPTYIVTGVVSPDGSGSILGNGNYLSGDTATLIATPVDGYAFSSWGGDASGSSATTTITVDANKTAIAYFTPVIPCSTLALSGGQGYETREVNLGADIGTVTLNYDAYTIPDRFVVTWNGSVVIDTGFVGNGDDIDPDSGQTYNELLIAMGLPPVSGPGAGIASFVKNLPTPATATVQVYGPFSGTGWEFTLGCPS